MIDLLLLFVARPASARPAPACGADGVPAGIAGLRIVLRQLVPLGTSNAVQIVDYPAVAQSELAVLLLVPLQSRAVHIGESELPLLEFENSNIGWRSHREIAQLFMFDLPRRIPRGAANHVVH